MSREKEGYRENLELLNERYPDHDMLTAKEVAVFLGVSEQTTRRRIRFNPATRRVSKADLARQVGG